MTSFNTKQCKTWVPFSKSIDKSAVLPNLPFLPRKDADPAHLAHGDTEVVEEAGGTAGVPVHQLLRNLTVKKSRIGLEKPSFLDNSTVVAAIEAHGASGVHLHNSTQIPGLALLPQFLGVGGIQGRIAVALPGEVVEPIAERIAVGVADSVGT